MRTCATAYLLGITLSLTASIALAGSPPVPSTWNITPVPGSSGVAGNVTFAANGKGKSKQGPVPNISVRWFAGAQDGYYWYLMQGKVPFQAFRYSPTQGGGYSCAVETQTKSGDFKCTDNGFNFTMTQASGK